VYCQCVARNGEQNQSNREATCHSVDQDYPHEQLNQPGPIALEVLSRIQKEWSRVLGCDRFSDVNVLSSVCIVQTSCLLLWGEFLTDSDPIPQNIPPDMSWEGFPRGRTNMGWPGAGPFTYTILPEPFLSSELARLSNSSSERLSDGIRLDSVTFQPCPLEEERSQDRLFTQEIPFGLLTGIFDGLWF
jgi:hypothetical protein